MKTAIISTTINVPKIIEGYVDDMHKHDVHPEEAMFIFVGDKKSPPSAKAYVEDLQKRSEYEIRYYDVGEQAQWLGVHGIDDDQNLMPYNSVRRRNVAYLMAYQEGVDAILTLDDDNFAIENNLRTHTDAFKGWQYDVTSKNRFINPCRLLQYNNATNAAVYSRGFPIGEIYQDTFEPQQTTNSSVAMNMGLWTKSPDVDSYTHLMYDGLQSVGMSHSKSFIAAPGNYIPIDTQNTIFKRELLPAYYFMLMDTVIEGNQIDRYDDIWAGWVVQKIMHNHNNVISFGTPLAMHDRNTHNYVADLKHEFPGVVMNHKMWEIIDSAELSSNVSYAENYLEVVDAIRMKSRKAFTNESARAFIVRLTHAMEKWVDVCDKVK